VFGATATGMTVVLVRLWFEGTELRARIMFEADDLDTPQSVVVGSVEDICDLIRKAVDARRPS